jgi:hypothetical protein
MLFYSVIDFKPLAMSATSFRTFLPTTTEAGGFSVC